MAKSPNRDKKSTSAPQTRSRSPEDKALQMQKILDGSLELISEKGFDGFGMRSLAKHINMSQGNLYNYIASKRELWLAVRYRCMREFKEGMTRIVSTHKGTFFNLFKELGNYVLDFAAEDDNRWKLMTCIPPPDSSKVGPIEKRYKSVNTAEIINEMLKRAVYQKELDEDDLDLLGMYFYGMIMGATFVEREFKLQEDIYEPYLLGDQPVSSKKFRQYFFKQMESQFKKQNNLN